MYLCPNGEIKRFLRPTEQANKFERTIKGSGLKVKD